MRGRSFVMLTVLAGCAAGRPDFDSGDVSIVPAAPRTTDTMMAVLLEPDPNAVFTWSRDGVVAASLVTSIVPAAETTRDEVWRVTVTDYFGASIGGAEATILNSPPTAPEISLPPGASADRDLICVIDAMSTDADGDPITYRAEWTENGAPFTDTTTTTFPGDTVPAAFVQADDVFVCTVIVEDGVDSATASTDGITVNDCGDVPLPPPMTFDFTGAPQMYTVPTCVTSLRIEAWGAQGANGGGLGGLAAGDYAVVEGSVLVVEVGGRNGYNGGGLGASAANPGHGGGASDVRTGAALADRVIVGAGGGGGITPGDVGAYNGGGGGGGTCGANYCGGAGGAGYGGTGGAGGADGGAGITNAHGGGGGGGGMNSGGQGACKTYGGTACAMAGAIGTGGPGEPSSANPACYASYGGTAGGGGGYYGGGGSASGYCGGGGGGGGSSWTGVLANPSFTASTRSGDGMITITPLSTQ